MRAHRRALSSRCCASALRAPLCRRRRRGSAGGARGIAGARAWAREFVPSLDEGDIALHALRIPGTSLTQAVQMQTQLEARLAQLPEVERSVRASSARPRSPPTRCRRRSPDTFVMLKDREPNGPIRASRRRSSCASSKRPPRAMPGNNYEFTQPIQMRFNELISGVRADVAVKVYGDDLDTLLDARRAGRDGARRQ